MKRIIFIPLFLFFSFFYLACSEENATPAPYDSHPLIERIASVHQLSKWQKANLLTIFRNSGRIGQGNPSITVHPATEAQCEENLKQLALSYENSDFEKICGGLYMAPLYDPATSKAKVARVCIDQFEFPDIPCTYPVVWVRAREAAEICRIMGKRLCNAHEWEGSCAGSLQAPDYRFDLAIGVEPSVAIEKMQSIHNRKYGENRVWSYGKEYRTGVCATSGTKSPGCDGSSYERCGSNTFPSGFFPECHSSLLVYDLNGNTAEHMNLPLRKNQMAGQGSGTLGYTEMKGSWFVFDTIRAHEDWCRWRAPYWHGTPVMSAKSHRNYHLGFRCCKDLIETETK